MRKLWAALAAAIIAALLAVGMAFAASSATTGTNVACATATATTPVHTVGVDGSNVDTISGTSTTASHCVTQTYTVPTTTVTQTYTAPATTVTQTVTATPSSSTSSSSTTTSSSTTSTPQPTGDPGNWTLAFDDEFNGTSLDTSKWNAVTWNNSNVTGDPADVSVANGVASLITSKEGSGSTRGSGGFLQSDYQLPIGGFMEASVYMPGSATSPDNWDGFWASGANWPDNGEEDVIEGLGSATSNYHSPDGANNSGPIAGTWSNAFHTYGMYRGQNSITIYWDGKVVRTYTRTDDGGAQNILLDAASNAGPDNSVDSPTVLGAAGAMKVDYVRAWVPAS